ncbi:hypothetical protein JW960_11525 [candidate division KSB1 bacterium]|nr:hypothetical protein [candidate division KSB1 bacterium]
MTYIPNARYRIQFNHRFTFQMAKSIVPYLAQSGVTDMYASPIFKACKRSLHGYDVVDPTELNPELGTAQDFDALIADLHHYRMGWIQDIVPNHMAYDAQNRMLMDVLEHGLKSQFAHFFDVDWNPHYESITDKILAPFLGEFYAESLENGTIQLQYGEDGLKIYYYEHQYPVRIDSYTRLFTYRLDQLQDRMSETNPDFIKLLGVLYTIKQALSHDNYQDQYNQALFVKRMLWDLYQSNQQFKQFVDENINIFNGEPGKPESYNLLDELLSEQYYRMAFWKVGTEEINYRRFFYVNNLISLNMHNADVFQKLHALLLQHFPVALLLNEKTM